MGLAITTWPIQTHAAPTELGSAFGGRRGYKHGAPNGLSRLWRPQMAVRCKEDSRIPRRYRVLRQTAASGIEK